jgi:hypothetical protein
MSPTKRTTSNDLVISDALHTFLTAQLQSGGPARCFFRLDGFDEAVYQGLLTRIHADEDGLVGRPPWVRTTGPIPGYKAYALDKGKSATWYRNHVPPGHALVPIFNRRTSDAQSLKDIYPVTESLVATKRLHHLIAAAFTDHELSRTPIGVLYVYHRLAWDAPEARAASFTCENRLAHTVD